MKTRKKTLWLLIFTFLFSSSTIFGLDDALYKAIEKGNLSQVKRLINSSNLDKMKFMGDSSEMEYAPIGAAGMFEKHDIIKWLLSQGAKPDGGTTYDTALWWIVFKAGRYVKYDKYHKTFMNTARLLLQKGAKPNYNISNYNGSPLMIAAGYADKKMIALLKQYGGDPSVVLYKKRGSAADYAERAGHIELANELRGKSNYAYRNSLVYAVKKNNLAKVKSIISQASYSEKKELINKQEKKSKRTALHYAALGGHLAIVKYLVEQGADINVKSLGSFTPLHTATAHRKSDVAMYLVKKGANINIVQSSGCATGYTAFNWALETSNIKLARLMLQKGADPHAGRRNPLEMARSLKMIKMMVQEFNIKPSEDVVENYKNTVAKYKNKKNSYWYKQQKKIYDYLKMMNTVPEKPSFSASAYHNADTSFKSFEPFNVNNRKR